jgi:hypothetical protein
MLSKLPGVGKLGGFLGKIPGLSKLGGLFGFGGGGGAAAGAAGAAGSASGMSGILAAAGGPVGIGIAAAMMIGMPLMKKLFSHDYLKDYKKLVKGEYGISISDQMAGKIMQIGQSKFGNEWTKREIETVRLQETRDMLAEYAGAFQKGGNGKLFDSRMWSDQFSAVNQIKVGMRAMGGPVSAGGAYIVGERRPELFIPQTSGRVVPNLDGLSSGRGGSQSDPEMRGLMQGILEHLSRLKQADVGAIYEMGAKQRPGVARRDVEDGMRNDHEFRKTMRDGVVGR